MSKTNNWKTGQIGENLAAKFLAENGLEIIARNYRTRFGEIDIIARCDTPLYSPFAYPFSPSTARSPFERGKVKTKDFSPYEGEKPPTGGRGVYVFVEVKTKIGDQFGTPEEMINPGKIAKVLKMASVYLTKEGLGDQSCRLDAVAIVLDVDLSVVSLHHYPCIT